ncbi:hypothetical protein CYMTET_39823, partial [Cymbomonas tetramitiformis]
SVCMEDAERHAESGTAARQASDHAESAPRASHGAPHAPPASKAWAAGPRQAGGPRTSFGAPTLKSSACAKQQKRTKKAVRYLSDLAGAQAMGTATPSAPNLNTALRTLARAQAVAELGAVDLLGADEVAAVTSPPDLSTLAPRMTRAQALQRRRREQEARVRSRQATASQNPTTPPRSAWDTSGPPPPPKYPPRTHLAEPLPGRASRRPMRQHGRSAGAPRRGEAVKHSGNSGGLEPGGRLVSADSLEREISYQIHAEAQLRRLRQGGSSATSEDTSCALEGADWTGPSHDPYPTSTSNPDEYQAEGPGTSDGEHAGRCWESEGYGSEESAADQRVALARQIASRLAAEQERRRRCDQAPAPPSAPSNRPATAPPETVDAVGDVVGEAVSAALGSLEDRLINLFQIAEERLATFLVPRGGAAATFSAPTQRNDEQGAEEMMPAPPPAPLAGSWGDGAPPGTQPQWDGDDAAEDRMVAPLVEDCLRKLQEMEQREESLLARWAGGGHQGTLAKPAHAPPLPQASAADQTLAVQPSVCAAAVTTAPVPQQQALPGPSGYAPTWHQDAQRRQEEHVWAQPTDAPAPPSAPHMWSGAAGLALVGSAEQAGREASRAAGRAMEDLAHLHATAASRGSGGITKPRASWSEPELGEASSHISKDMLVQIMEARNGFIRRQELLDGLLVTADEGFAPVEVVEAVSERLLVEMLNAGMEEFIGMCDGFVDQVVQHEFVAA